MLFLVCIIKFFKKMFLQNTPGSFATVKCIFKFFLNVNSVKFQTVPIKYSIFCLFSSSATVFIILYFLPFNLCFSQFFSAHKFFVCLFKVQGKIKLIYSFTCICYQNVLEKIVTFEKKVKNLFDSS